jgi:hypothetical protein
VVEAVGVGPQAPVTMDGVDRNQDRRPAGAARSLRHLPDGR